MNQEIFYQIALSKVSGIGAIRFKKIMSKGISAQEIFSANTKKLKKDIGLNETLANEITTFSDFERIKKELNFCEKNNISILTLFDEKYPSSLRNCIDAPPILFLKGNYDFNQPKIISIIGTRNFSDYGKQICEELIHDLKPYGVCIVSGLAYGIDIIAHKQAVKEEIPTIGVVAHGLDRVYPSVHKNTAQEMQLNGGLLSEYFSGTLPNKENFPTRNRIVAGISEATIVIETDIKGGSMITAELANSYNKEVFCIPGRIKDAKSAGCNYLIKNLKASLISSADDIVNNLGWNKVFKPKQIQKQLYIDFSEDEQKIIAILQEKELFHIDEILQKTEMNSSQIAATLLNLEMQNIIKVKPGKMISILS